MDQSVLAARLLSSVESQAAPQAASWLSAAARRRDSDLAWAYTDASRRLGRAPLALSREEVESMAQAGLAWSTAAWGVDDAARVALLLIAAVRLAEPRFLSLIEELHRLGDPRERGALARALPLLPGAGRFLALARSVARSEIPALFSALACDNPYPVRHFPDEALRQLALKAEALGFPRARLLGFERRRSMELETLLAAGEPR